MCARSAHRRHRAGLGLLGIDIFFAGFSVPKNPRSSIRTSGPKLTVADIRQLAKLLSGFVTGQITVARVVVTVAAQSLARGK